MIGRLMDMLTRRDDRAGPETRIRLAAAALLVEAALLDGRMDDAERRHIHHLLRERFQLDPGEADELMAEAVAAVTNAVELHGFTKAVKDAFPESDRVRLIEMLWEVAYADGHLHDYEANLVRRVAGLLYVSDQDSGTARKRALARLGMGDGLA